MWHISLKTQLKYGTLFGVFAILTATIGVAAGLVGVAATLWAYFVIRRLWHATTRSSWEEAAEEIADMLNTGGDEGTTELELEHGANRSEEPHPTRPSELALSGTIEGRPARIHVAGPQESRRTVWEIDCTDFLPDWLELRPASVRASADWWVDTGDVKVGHEELDRRFLVGGAEPDRVRSFFWDHELGDDFAEVFDAVGSFEIADGVLRDSREGIVRRTRMLRNQAARLRTIAARLEIAVTSDESEMTLPDESSETDADEDERDERQIEEDEAIHVYD